MIKAIVFDAYGTLFEVTSGGSSRIVRQYLIDKGIIVDEGEFREKWKRFYKEYTSPDREFITEKELFTLRNKLIYDRFGLDRDPEEDAVCLLARAGVRDAFPDVKPVIDELKKEYPVYIGSNTDDLMIEDTLRRNDISVNKVFTSEDLRCYKPNARFYESILEYIQLPPDEVLFAGDSITADVEGPKSAGLKTAWVDRKNTGGDHGQDYTVRDLFELKDILTMKRSISQKVNDDWRLQGQERYLKGHHFDLKTWCSDNPAWDHDHCEFCMEEISDRDEAIQEAYATEDNKHWICKRCFKDFEDLLI